MANVNASAIVYAQGKVNTTYTGVVTVAVAVTLEVVDEGVEKPPIAAATMAWRAAWSGAVLVEVGLALVEVTVAVGVAIEDVEEDKDATGMVVVDAVVALGIVVAAPMIDVVEAAELVVEVAVAVLFRPKKPRTSSTTPRAWRLTSYRKC
jgi:hypothetical protein